MSHSLNSLKGGYIGDYIGTTIGVTKGDTRSLDYSSHMKVPSPPQPVSLGFRVFLPAPRMDGYRFH